MASMSQSKDSTTERSDVAVSKRLGHAQVSITLDIYTHYIPGDKLLND